MNGHFDLIIWALDNGCPYDQYISVEAVASENVDAIYDFLQWLKNKGYVLHTHTITSAVKNNNFELVKWLRINGCCWDESSCSAAAKIGNLTMLQ